MPPPMASAEASVTRSATRHASGPGTTGGTGDGGAATGSAAAARPNAAADRAISASPAPISVSDAGPARTWRAVHRPWRRRRSWTCRRARWRRLRADSPARLSVVRSSGAAARRATASSRSIRCSRNGTLRTGYSNANWSSAARATSFSRARLQRRRRRDAGSPAVSPPASRSTRAARPCTACTVRRRVAAGRSGNSTKLANQTTGTAERMASSCTGRVEGGSSRYRPM